MPCSTGQWSGRQHGNTRGVSWPDVAGARSSDQWPAALSGASPRDHAGAGRALRLPIGQLCNTMAKRTHTGTRRCAALPCPHGGQLRDVHVRRNEFTSPSLHRPTRVGRRASSDKLRTVGPLDHDRADDTWDVVASPRLNRLDILPGHEVVASKVSNYESSSISTHTHPRGAPDRQRDYTKPEQHPRCVNDAPTDRGRGDDQREHADEDAYEDVGATANSRRAGHPPRMLARALDGNGQDSRTTTAAPPVLGRTIKNGMAGS